MDGPNLEEQIVDPHPPDLHYRLPGSGKKRKRSVTHEELHQLAQGGWCGGVPELNHKAHQGKPGSANIDHIIPRSLGGGNAHVNLRPVCIAVHLELTRILNQRVGEGWGLVEWVGWQAEFGVAGKLIERR